MKTKPRVEVRPVLVSHDTAAAMLGQISPRTLDAMVKDGKLKARRITGGKKGRIGYLVREIEALADGLPVVIPGVDTPVKG